MADAFSLLKPFLHKIDPETVHGLGIRALALGLMPVPGRAPHPALMVEALGLAFANPVGLAAGFDKNAVAINGCLKQGFGFVEAGTVTPLAQPGNPRPRLFRLERDEAVINSLGFNNEGLEYFVAHFSRRDKTLGIAGANVGKNKDSLNAVFDYVMGIEAVYPHADYVTVNISSPNTPGLRALQAKESLEPLLSAVAETRQRCMATHGKRVPLLLKVAPDLEAQDMESIASLVLAHGIDGMIVSNTTVSRPFLKSRNAGQPGGLSGRPLFELSTEVLKKFHRLVGGKILLIGAGGVSSAADAYAKIRAGATLVQLYTALVYQGFEVVRAIERELPLLLEKDGFTHVSQAVGIDA